MSEPEPLTDEELGRLRARCANTDYRPLEIDHVHHVLAAIAARNRQIAAADELLTRVLSLRFATIEEAATFRADLDAYRKEFSDD